MSTTHPRITDIETATREPMRCTNRERAHPVGGHEAFSDDPDVSLNSIAKRAGVGPGTLYRHFPTREDLILAVYQHDVQAVVDSVPEVLAEHAARSTRSGCGSCDSPSTSASSTASAKPCHTAAAQDVVNETYAPVTAASVTS